MYSATAHAKRANHSMNIMFCSVWAIPGLAAPRCVPPGNARIGRCE